MWRVGLAAIGAGLRLSQDYQCICLFAFAANIGSNLFSVFVCKTSRRGASLNLVFLCVFGTFVVIMGNYILDSLVYLR